MAGHSKWANIKHRKGAQDAKRGQVFTKLAKELTVAAKIGGSDEGSNPRLRTAMLKARAANMPKDNIDRAVKKGAGELEGVHYEELVYEGYGPAGIAFMVEVMTDKTSRTTPEIKNIFKKAGGSMAESGAVSYQFEQKGVIVLKGVSVAEDFLFDFAIEAGADDLEFEDDFCEIFTAKDQFNQVLTKISKVAEEKGWSLEESSLKYIASNNLEVSVDDGSKILQLIETLEDHDDVQNVYTNLELTEEMIHL